MGESASIAGGAAPAAARDPAERALAVAGADGAPCGFAALDAVDSVRVRHRKGVPVICVKEPGRKLFLELAPESDVTAATWASTLCHLVRLARESSAFS